MTKPMSKKEFGEKLLSLLLARGWIQSDFARKAAVPRDAVSRYIRGVSWPSRPNIQKMASALGMKAEDLVPTNVPITIEMADDPPVEIRRSSDPTMCWIRINRLVKVSMLPTILQVLQDAENA